jgi:hypothetical protein
MRTVFTYCPEMELDLSSPVKWLMELSSPSTLVHAGCWAAWPGSPMCL